MTPTADLEGPRLGRMGNVSPGRGRVSPLIAVYRLEARTVYGWAGDSCLPGR